MSMHRRTHSDYPVAFINPLNPDQVRRANRFVRELKDLGLINRTDSVSEGRGRIIYVQLREKK